METVGKLMYLIIDEVYDHIVKNCTLSELGGVHVVTDPISCMYTRLKQWFRVTLVERSCFFEMGIKKRTAVLVGRLLQ